MDPSTPGTSMNKLIHRAVRRDLRRFRSALATFVDGDRERARGLHRAWENFDAQLTEHHQGEHQIAWPALTAIGVTGPTITSFDAEHDAMAADLALAGDAMRQLRDSASRADADAAGVAMARLETTTVTHLDHEEQETEAPLVQHRSHPAVKDMGRKFSRRSGPATAGTFFAWMQDTPSADDSAALRDHVPSPVLTVLGGLFGRRYRREVAPVWVGTDASSA